MELAKVPSGNLELPERARRKSFPSGSFSTYPEAFAVGRVSHALGWGNYEQEMLASLTAYPGIGELSRVPLRIAAAGTLASSIMNAGWLQT